MLEGAQMKRYFRLLASFFINKYSSPSVLIATLFIFGVVAAVKEVVIAVAEQRILSSILLLEQVIDVKYQESVQYLRKIVHNIKILNIFNGLKLNLRLHYFK